jgi:integrase
MSVRRRRWFTSGQVKTWATRLASEAGKTADDWQQYRDAAQAELTDLLRQARAEDDKALQKLKAFPPREAWVVDYFDQRGARHFETFKRKRDADGYAAKVKIEVISKTHIAPRQTPTVAEAAESWIKRVDAEGRERSTLTQYRQHVDIHIVPRIGTLRLAELAPTRVEAFRDDLLKHLSRPLARKVLTSLKSLLKVAKHSHLAADVSIGADKRDKHEVEVGRDYPSPSEVKRLIAAAPDNRMRALLLTAALTGLRASEIRGLRWKDVDLENRELKVTQRADWYGQIGSPKSRSSRRTVPLDQEVLIPALKAWKIECPPTDSDLAFPTSAGHIQDHNSLLRDLARVMQAAGIVDKTGKPKYAMHALRHFYASWCLNPVDRGGRQLSPKEVQTLMGHSSITMTMDIYGHLFARGTDGAELAAAARALFA